MSQTGSVAAALLVGAGATASAAGIDAAVDAFSIDYLGWFAGFILTSVPVGGHRFR